MAVIAVINGKGGAGKSTLATHLAAYCAGKGADVALCDLDPQRSTEAWLRLRPESAAKIRGYCVANAFTRPPDARHVIIDTPGGFQGMSYLRVMMYADAVLIPTAFSLFDRTALENIVRQLKTAPRVASGKCSLASIGTRLDPRSNDAALLETLLRGMGVSCLSTIPAARVYSRCLEQGLTVFDFPSTAADGQIRHWSAVIGWLETLFAKTAAPLGMPGRVAATLRGSIPRFLTR